MIFIRWATMSQTGRALVFLVALVLLILHLLNLIPSAAAGTSSHPRIQFFEYQWETPSGDFHCVAPAASSRIMGSTITIPGGAECVPVRVGVDSDSEVR